jgi:predicted dehydrogenase
MRKMALAGTGHRGTSMFGRMLVGPEAAGRAELVGLFDHNRLRLEAARRILGTTAPGFTDFDAMLRETGCDTVIVTTKDSTHAEYIERALRHGCAVITEKPLTVDVPSLVRILEAEQETGRPVTVTFNYRYMPLATAIKEFLRSGRLGTVTSVDFHWYLDTIHGADYFRRWHRQRRNSGSLFVHKATHHFDLVNWWLEQDPEVVFAQGTRRVYGDQGEPHGERCSTCEFFATCPYAFDWRGPHYQELYREAEREDGYWRDGCVFSEEVDIWDTMAATVTYRGGVLMTYSLFAYAPYEGFRIAFNGTAGRLECEAIEAVIPKYAPNFAERHALRTPPSPDDLRSAGSLRFYPIFGGMEMIAVPHGEGEHGGGDAQLRADLLDPGRPDPWGRRAGTRAGAYSILIGIAARESIDRGQAIRIPDLLPAGLLD